MAKRGQCVVLAGRPGCGKTSLAAKFPKPKFVTGYKEDGILDLIESGAEQELSEDDVFVIESGKESFSELLGYVRSEVIGSDYKTLVVESARDLQVCMYDELCHEQFNDNWTKKKGGFYGDWFMGPRTAAQIMAPQITDVIKEVRAAGINVVITAHTVNETDDNSEGSDYMRTNLNIDRQWRPVLETYVPNILVMREIVLVSEDEDGKSKGKRTDGDMYLLCTHSSSHCGKNRWGLREDIKCGDDAAATYSNLCKAINFNRKTFRFKKAS